jgi:hypothetical protein
MNSQRLKKEEAAVAAWNHRYPVGTSVTYWTFTRTGPGKRSRTRSAARVDCGIKAVVLVEGHRSCIALTHVEPIGEPVADALGHAQPSLVEAAYRCSSAKPQEP